MNIENRVFLVTDAGSGLGAAVARMIAQGGGKVALLDVNAEAGNAVAGQLGDAGRFFQTDVTSEANGEAAVASAVEAFRRIDGLVNCAGIAPGERIIGREGPHRLDSFAAGGERHDKARGGRGG